MGNTITRTWRCTAGHVALTVMELEDQQRDYVVSKHCQASTDDGGFCGLPVSERTPQWRTPQ